MADDFLRVEFSADSSKFDKAADNVAKGAAKTEASMEQAAQAAADASTQIAAKMSTAADSVVASADKVAQKFKGLFDEAALPSANMQKTMAETAKSVSNVGASLDANQKQQASWGDFIVSSTAKARAAIDGAFSAIGKGAQVVGQTTVNAGTAAVAVVGAMGRGITSAAKDSEAAAAVHKRSSLLIAAAYAAAAAAVIASMRRAIQEGVSVSNLSEATGVGVEGLSRLKYAAEQAGVSFDIIRAMVQKYGETVKAVALDPTDKANQAMAAMSLTFFDSAGKAKNFDTVLGEVADKFTGYANGANKAALAQALFSKSGEDIIPLLNRGAAGIRELGDQAKRAGAVMDEDMARKMKEANAEIAKYNASITNLGVELVSLLIPLRAAADEVSKFSKYLQNIYQNGTDPIRLTEAAIARVQDRIDNLNKNGVTFADQLFGRDTQTLLERAELELAALNAQLRILKEATGTPLQVGINNVNPWKTEVKPEAPNLVDTKKIRDDLDDIQDRLQGLPVLMGQAFALDAKPFEEAAAAINRAVEGNVVSAAEATRIKRGLARQEQGFILDTASLAASTLTTVFGQNKNAAIGSALINTAVGVTKALSSAPPPYSFIQAGLVAAAGAAQIAAISSATETGGGSVAGVSAGQAAAAPQGPAAPTAAPEQRSLVVQGINPRSLFTGEHVRGLAEELLAFQEDGGKVIFDRGR